MARRFVTVSALAALVSASVDMAAAADRFEYRKGFSLKVGESRVVYAARHNDCKSVPDYADVARRLPETGLGHFSDGGPKRARSRSCGGEIPTRGVLFTADRAGSETLNFFDYEVTLTVR